MAIKIRNSKKPTFGIEEIKTNRQFHKIKQFQCRKVTKRLNLEVKKPPKRSNTEKKRNQIEQHRLSNPQDICQSKKGMIIMDNEI